jgi:hypothetical protein
MYAGMYAGMCAGMCAEDCLYSTPKQGKSQEVCRFFETTPVGKVVLCANKVLKSLP